VGGRGRNYNKLFILTSALIEMELDKAIQKRSSVKKFKSKKPDWRDIVEAIDAARYAPMAGGNYSLKFILVNDSEIIKNIAEACQQPFVGTANYLVVACSVHGRTTNAYGKQGEVYVRQQAGAAIQNFLLKIEEAGLATCWVGYFVEDLIKKELHIPDNTQVEAVFPIGFEYEKKRTKRAKIELDRIFYFNGWEQKMNEPKKMDV
jgi:nitroreductase